MGLLVHEKYVVGLFSTNDAPCTARNAGNPSTEEGGSLGNETGMVEEDCPVTRPAKT